MHWFKPYSTLFTKIRYVALFEKVLFAEGGAIRASQQKTHIFKQVFASSMESTVSSCYTSLQQCCTLCKQESALSKVKTHVSMNVSVRWHSFQNHAVVIQE